ncbi:MAG: hypothetical protein VB042_02710 [Victivallaceae bacterium]|nr:hypothetical protein [Victivallaceae bacterium]
MKRFFNYTLIELVLVMTIIAVVLSLTLVSINRLVAAQSLDTAVRNLDNAMVRARNLAIYHQTYVALLLPDSGKFIRYGGVPCRSYRFCEVKKNGNDYEFYRWLPGKDWENLSDSVIIAGARARTSSDKDPYAETKNMSTTVTDNPEYEINSSGALADASNPVVRLGDDADTTKALNISDVKVADKNGSQLVKADCPGIIFDKYGVVQNAAGVNLVLCEGFADAEDGDDYDVVKRKYTRTVNDGTTRKLANWAEMRLEVLTGEPRSRVQGQSWTGEEYEK